MNENETKKIPCNLNKFIPKPYNLLRLYAIPTIDKLYKNALDIHPIKFKL